MKLDVSHVPEAGIEVSVAIDASEVNLSDETAQLGSDLHLEGRVFEAGEQMLLEGRLRGTFSLNCSRCLKPFDSPFDIDVSARYVNAPEAEHQDRADSNIPEEVIIPFVGDEIDLISGIREDLILNVPLKPLCSEDCRGLCAQCGADLNEGDCKCDRKTVDPRLAGLRDLRTQIEKGQHK
jgi:uncharacterized protein